MELEDYDTQNAPAGVGLITEGTSSLKGKEVRDLSVIVHGDVPISARPLQA